ncbi:hypothetical protein F751_5592 [Auxenochlorella protothecoides]|nr:hypothetical protein F751_5592 [Auxenochlorella protothecoides]KFM22883.1 hypothetical protein F751_5592 [Auxenochlorella protothecoides]
MDALEALSGSSSDSEAEAEPEPQPAAKRSAATKISLEDLQQHGYSGGPSVLYVPPPADADPNWTWSSGADRKGVEPVQESREERERNREAVTSGLDEEARLARAAVSHAQQLKAGRRAEAQAQKEAANLSWKQKEKRKRERGQQASSKNYIEEEKRRARQYGMVSGFDT